GGPQGGAGAEGGRGAHPAGGRLGAARGLPPGAGPARHGPGGPRGGRRGGGGGDRAGGGPAGAAGDRLRHLEGEPAGQGRLAGDRPADRSASLSGGGRRDQGMAGAGPGDKGGGDGGGS